MGVAAAGARDVILRDGSTLRLRPPRREDADALLAFFAGLSERSLHLRFHGVPALVPRLVESFLEPDWVERGALVGTLGEERGERIVALASYARLRDPATAEAAFAVADELQGRGIGARLLEQLVAAAAEAGLENFVAEVMPENRPMLSVFVDAGFEIVRELEGGSVEVRFPIAATERYRTRVDERDHIAVVASLRPFFEPTSVAVAGASSRRGSIGGELFRNILEGDFAGAAYPVNLSGEPVAGIRAYRSIDEIPGPVDLAVVCVPAELVLEVVESALRKGTRGICVVSAGFAELGSEGAARQERLLATVRAHGARLIGPNCLGIAVSGPRLNATFGPRALPPGSIGFSSQSGALGLALLEKAAERGLGLSAFASIGNKADVSTNDLLEYWEDDPATDVVVLYVESFGNPRKFARLARRVARSKPILAMKSGRTSAGARAASSHTAALAGSETAVDALFHHAGVIRAETLGELVDAAALLSTQPAPLGRRVALLTNAGGLGILCADACEASGLEVGDLSEETRAALAAVLPPEASFANPVDMLGSATGETYEAVLPRLLADPRVDAVIVLFVPPVVTGAEEVARAVRRVVDGLETPEKPLLAVFVTGEPTPACLVEGPRPIATFPYPESAARALGRAADRGDWLRRPAGTVPELAGIDRERVEAIVAERLAGESDLWLEPADARALLESYGVPVVAERIAGSVEEAVRAARELGFPVVVKTATAGVHKTEIGGVALDLGDEEDVRAAVERLGAPALVQPMVEGLAELLAGAVQDPVFGPLVAFGPGGVLAELIGQAQFRIAPLTDLDAAELVRAGKAGRLVAGFRGGEPADADALEELVLRLSRLAEDVPEVVELDANPVLALPHGCVAVDVRIRLRRPERAVRTKTW